VLANKGRICLWRVGIEITVEDGTNGEPSKMLPVRLQRRPECVGNRTLKAKRNGG